jgi:hypothetical protein
VNFSTFACSRSVIAATAFSVISLFFSIVGPSHKASFTISLFFYTEKVVAPYRQVNPQIGKAVGILMDLSADERTRLLEESHQKALWDYNSRMKALSPTRETAPVPR